MARLFVNCRLRVASLTAAITPDYSTSPQYVRGYLKGIPLHVGFMVRDRGELNPIGCATRISMIRDDVNAVSIPPALTLDCEHEIDDVLCVDTLAPSPLPLGLEGSPAETQVPTLSIHSQAILGSACSSHRLIEGTRRHAEGSRRVSLGNGASDASIIFISRGPIQASLRRPAMQVLLSVLATVFTAVFLVYALLGNTRSCSQHLVTSMVGIATVAHWVCVGLARCRYTSVAVRLLGISYVVCATISATAFAFEVFSCEPSPDRSHSIRLNLLCAANYLVLGIMLLYNERMWTYAFVLVGVPLCCHWYYFRIVHGMHLLGSCCVVLAPATPGVTQGMG